MARTQDKAGALGNAPVGKLILRFAIPSIVGMVVSAIYNIVDQVFIGWGIGFLGIAATNVAFPLTTISTALALLLGIGGAASYNLYMGQGESRRAGYTMGNALTLLAIVGLVVGLVALTFATPLLLIFGATESVMPYAIPYTSIIAVGLPFAVFSTGACHLIRADGSPNVSMACMLAGAAFNLIFDPVFLFVLDWGIAGIAWATSLGQMLSSAIAATYLIKKRSASIEPKQLIPKAEYGKRISSLGMAACFNQLAMTVVQIALNKTLVHYGALSVYGSEIPLACVGAISKLNVIFMAFVIGISQGCQPIMSFNYGARNYTRVKHAYRLALTWASALAVTAFLIFQLFPRQIVMIFGEGSEEYFSFAIRYLRVYMLMTFLNGIQPLSSNFFTAIGKARMGMLVSLTRQIIFLLPLILLLPLMLGIDGVMYAGPIADGAAAALAMFLVVREIRAMPRDGATA